MRLFSVVILILLLSACSAKRYYLTDQGKDKKFLLEKIHDMKRQGLAGEKPILVIDGVPYRFDYELKADTLHLKKEQIKQIDVLKRDMGIQIYGDFARDGVLLITTK